MEPGTFNLREELKTDGGKKALDKLIKKGCKEKQLAIHIEWLITDSVESEGLPPIPVKPFDSLETCLDPEDGNHSFTMEELKQISKLAKKLKKHVLQLVNTDLIYLLFSKGKLSKEDILLVGATSSPVFNDKDGRITRMFEGLISLPEAAKEYCRKKEKANHYKFALIEYVEKTTGKPNYGLIGTILNDLAPGKYCNYDPNATKGKHSGEPAATSLREWYNDEKKKRRVKKLPAKVAINPAKSRRIKDRK